MSQSKDTVVISLPFIFFKAFFFLVFHFQNSLEDLDPLVLKWKFVCRSTDDWSQLGKKMKNEKSAPERQPEGRKKKWMAKKIQQNNTKNPFLNKVFKSPTDLLKLNKNLNQQNVIAQVGVYCGSLMYSQKAIGNQCTKRKKEKKIFFASLPVSTAALII